MFMYKRYFWGAKRKNKVVLYFFEPVIWIPAPPAISLDNDQCLTYRVETVEQIFACSV